MDARELIERLALAPLPREGGWYRETYRSADRLAAGTLPGRFRRDKSAATAILYLLTADSCSRLHRLPTDELFHFHMGGAVEMLLLHADGPASTPVLGNDLTRGEHPQIVVPAGAWQGSRVRAGGAWSLMSVTVSPGFDFEDYEEPEALEPLLARWPGHAAAIHALAPIRA